MVRNYREAHKMVAANGILFNHESELRPARFVTQKVVQSAYRISCGSTEKLTLGELGISCDWGWAPEYAEAMWRILQADQADDFVIATGEANSLKNFVEQAFACFDLHWVEQFGMMINSCDPTRFFGVREIQKKRTRYWDGRLANECGMWLRPCVMPSERRCDKGMIGMNATSVALKGCVA